LDLKFVFGLAACNVTNFKSTALEGGQGAGFRKDRSLA
jgi:hypothetical protein